MDVRRALVRMTPPSQGALDDSGSPGENGMVTVEWDVQATEFANCNCDFGCPCQFNAAPTHGDCRAVVGYRIEQGHFGDVQLDGLRAAALYSWPGPIHEGNGTMQLIIDERADAKQRDALTRIMSGDETEEMATMWWVFAAMSPNKLAPQFKPVHFDVDVESRHARLSVPGVVETSGDPIRNPISGADHRVQIGLPHGFEFRLAEIGSGTTKSTGAIALDLKGTHGHFAHVHFSNKGVVA
jgi:hypothetical protein